MRTLVMAAGLVAAGGAVWAEGVTLTLNTPGGAVLDGGNAVLWGPAAAELGYEVKIETSDNSLDALRLQVGANAVNTDIIVMSGYQSAIAANEGMLAPLDYAVIDAKDFVEGAATPYCIGIYGYAAVMAWNTKTYPDKAPASWADFWDTEAFPGRRAMRADAEAQVEMALLSQGVAPADLYTVLATEEGMQRAIDRIAELKPEIAVWWNSGAQHGQLMLDGEVDMTTGWNGRFQTAKANGGPVEFTYNQGILAYDCFAIPAASQHKEEAMKLINLMSAAKAQAALTGYVAYGPMNKAAFDTGLISPEVAAVLPTSPANSGSMIVQDINWWAANNDRIQQMFEDMMTQ